MIYRHSNRSGLGSPEGSNSGCDQDFQFPVGIEHAAEQRRAGRGVAGDDPIVPDAVHGGKSPGCGQHHADALRGLGAWLLPLSSAARRSPARPDPVVRILLRFTMSPWGCSGPGAFLPGPRCRWPCSDVIEIEHGVYLVVEQQHVETTLI